MLSFEKKKLLYAYRENALNVERSTKSVYISVNNYTYYEYYTILSIYTKWNGLSQKTISRCCPFKDVHMCTLTCFQGTRGPCSDGDRCCVPSASPPSDPSSARTPRRRSSCDPRSLHDEFGSHNPSQKNVYFKIHHKFLPSCARSVLFWNLFKNNIL